jgi:hypothetical protein
MITLSSGAIKINSYYLFNSPNFKDRTPNRIIRPEGYITINKTVQFRIIAANKRDIASLMSVTIETFKNFLKRGILIKIKREDFPLYISWPQISKEFLDILKEGTPDPKIVLRIMRQVA